jgi:hypothetical protein
MRPLLVLLLLAASAFGQGIELRASSCAGERLNLRALDRYLQIELSGRPARVRVGCGKSELLVELDGELLAIDPSERNPRVIALLVAEHLVRPELRPSPPVSTEVPAPRVTMLRFSSAGLRASQRPAGVAALSLGVVAVAGLVVGCALFSKVVEPDDPYAYMWKGGGALAFSAAASSFVSASVSLSIWSYRRRN